MASCLINIPRYFYFRNLSLQHEVYLRKIYVLFLSYLLTMNVLKLCYLLNIMTDYWYGAVIGITLFSHPLSGQVIIKLHIVMTTAFLFWMFTMYQTLCQALYMQSHFLKVHSKVDTVLSLFIDEKTEQ